jgi:hypothetical protein
LGLPLATLIAGFYTLRLTSADSLDVVSDPVKRTAQVQRIDLSTDETTRDLGLSALLALEGDQVKVKLLPEGAVDADTALVLRLEHPIDAQQDVRVRLQPAPGGGWVGLWPHESVAWRVQLSPPHLEWRLLGRAGKSNTVSLLPALSAEDPDARR